MNLVEKALQKLRERGDRAEVPGNVAPNGKAPDAHRGWPREMEPPRPAKHVQLDRLRLRAAGFLPPEHHERELAEEYRQIKRPLLARAYGRGLPPVTRGATVTVTSSMPGEGKTFTSLNLALSIAREKDTSVLLVDADAARCHMSHLCGISGETGLLDLLRDDTLDPDALTVGTDVPGLCLLAAGGRVENATELFSSRRMESLIELMMARHPWRIVLFDSPPLLLTTEARALAQSTGQILLVVRAEITPQSAVLESIRQLGETRPVGLVLNQSERRQGHGYYYSYSDRDESERAPAAPSGSTPP